MNALSNKEQLLDRENAHSVGLLQNPFNAQGSSGAFPGLPEHLSFVKSVPARPGTPTLNPWKDGGKFPDGCPEDPFALVKEELSPFSDSIKDVVDTDHPILSEAAKHFFAERQGKRFRPTIVMLMAKATAPNPKEHRSGPVYEKQAELGQITEMIHVASLIHDDVLDEADTRRGGESVHKLYSNKVAVIAGDYLLARASVVLARLENTEVTEIMSTALESLVQGEIMQIKTGEDDLLDMMTYLRKSYHKTASLICDACKSCAILAGHAADSEEANAAEEYGYHLGLSYQIIDDVLDFTGASDVLGKPAMADVSLGLSTAPVLYAAESIAELKPMIRRKFKQEGDVEKTLRFVLQSDGIERAKSLALFHAQRAVNAICRLPESEERNALISLAHMVLSRKS
ncbi:geranylgeranyl pyrophosphate synthase [Guillardia theta CCMP2712]|uniref:Geranylgeranyl pyrophosphate synthase n=1 Tax=Guillardia theta (strain CCMP2712) TaxID=905079 RepID=L1JNL9_GUITC|nr:geranylgeranyl pyrophosphate synthase [Guillardia theta CCMP2712]EKX50057.1 geranylgeranyl pyrophosphate synthase [Guillardia theta CCMP2712]|eukprot:XP_005837037.1 geranylgeranyl pyrophosphate synthase [Guillardia theta CCMP2712]